MDHPGTPFLRAAERPLHGALMDRILAAARAAGLATRPTNYTTTGAAADVEFAGWRFRLTLVPYEPLAPGGTVVEMPRRER